MDFINCATEGLRERQVKVSNELSEVVRARVPKLFKELVDMVVTVGGHASESELVRAALREYIQEHYPDIWRKMMKMRTLDETQLTLEEVVSGKETSSA